MRTLREAMGRVAVCMCTCDRAAMLDRVLSRIAGATLGDLRREQVVLVVVDNAPGGSVASICEARRGSLPMDLHVVEEGRRGISFARNRAVAHAMTLDAEHVAFIDDDDEPEPDWLIRLLERRVETGADLVFGTWRLPDDLQLPRHLASLRYFQPMRLEARNRYGLPAWAGTYNVLLSRRVLDEFAADGPLFRPEFARSGGGDTDLFIRAQRRGFAYALAPGSVVVRAWEAGRLTFAGVVRRSFLRGGTRFHLSAAHMPPERVRRMRWQALRDVVKSTVLLGAFPVAPKLGLNGGIRLAGACGVIYAAAGGRFAYYGASAPRRDVPAS